MVNFQTDTTAHETEQEGLSPDKANHEVRSDARGGRAEILAIVQARGGSKGIPGKNIRHFGAHPLIAYSIAAALASSTVTRLIVSTDDAEIAEVAERYGAEVPFRRPAALATDDAQDFPLFAHALAWLKANEDYVPQVVVQLRPTSPLRPTGLINAGVNLLLADPDADCVRSVLRSQQNPYKMWRSGARYLVPLLGDEFPEPYNMPRQKLPKTYWQTGHLDVIRYETIVKKKSLTGDKVLPLMIEPAYCTDIDTLEDWERAEWMLARGHLDIDMPLEGSVDTSASAQQKTRIPDKPALVVLDFDGVLTDNRVWVTESGEESVVCNRGDGMGLSMLRKSGVEVVVLSTERNPVVAARCKKLNLPCHQGIDDKRSTLLRLITESKVDLADVVYIGNDINDLACICMVGCGIAVADAHPSVLKAADLILSHRGGQGAVREFCDRVLKVV